MNVAASVRSPPPRSAARGDDAIVEAAYSIAGVVARPIEPASLFRALGLVEAGTLDERLHGAALSRRGWVSLPDAIDTARDALRAALGERVSLEHRGGSHWRAVVPGVRDEKELMRLLEAARDILRRFAPSEHVVLVGALGGEACSRASMRFRALLDPHQTADRVAVVPSAMRRAS
jgi:hypothetical protein